MVERHAGVATQTRIQRNAPVGQFDKPQIAILILHKDSQNVRPVPVRIPLEVFTGGDCTVAQIARSCERFDHDLLDGHSSG